ncbi:uracil-DNA glycosylase [Lichenihabitans psoromatis]|uniref:uracil-DNA glycosylase n=1 Tax=Lichenihabitans psoromatis TaxID=2528642 RepID=UPI0010385B1B|nr:uracil-DNA glycosylase [Lichenihabitans psoromatis]
MTALRDPAPDCPLCPRLVAFRRDAANKHPDWHNAPVPSFGPDDARLLIVGLAPGLQGANRTGRPFTGDWAGDLLYETLDRFGFSVGAYDERPDDGLRLIDCVIVNAVRCVPPANKPLPIEIKTCNGFLAATQAALPRLAAIVALGRIGHESLLRSRNLRLSAHPFGHGRHHDLGGATLFDSYHCSRYNTNTGVLTTEMFHAVFAQVRRWLDAAPPPDRAV